MSNEAIVIEAPIRAEAIIRRRVEELVQALRLKDINVMSVYAPRPQSRAQTRDRTRRQSPPTNDGPRHGHVNTRPSQSQPQLCPCESGRV